MNYKFCYDVITEVQEQLKAELLNGMADPLNYDLIQALAATHTLENYLTSCISKNKD